MNLGVPPTEWNARTGEFTPPGVTVDARSNSARDLATAASVTVELPLTASSLAGAAEWSPSRPEIRPGPAHRPGSNAATSRLSGAGSVSSIAPSVRPTSSYSPSISRYAVSVT